MTRVVRHRPSPLRPSFVACVLLALGCSITSFRSDPLQPAGRPNIILILTDDLDFRSMDRLHRLRSLLADQGATFTHFFVSDSLCCPSRSSILCGQYNHNHHILTNQPPLGGFEVFHQIGNESQTFPIWLRNAGYKTVFLGKYLNGYPNTVDKSYVPPGWDEWDSPVEGTPYAELSYKLNENGRIIAYGADPDDYLTDVLTRKAVRLIEESETDPKPFFMYVAPYAPHLPSTPAARYKDALPDVKAPRPASFNESNVSDKPRWLRRMKPLTDSQMKHIDDSYRKRLQSMLAVEDMVADLLNALAEAGKLDSTYVFFTSDNGYHLGEHRLLEGKQSPYDEDIHVPLIVRGPGVPAGTVRTNLTGNIDLAPTFADLAGAPIPDRVDGRSLVPLLGPDPPDAAQGRQALLLEHTERNRADTQAAPGNPAAVAPGPGLLEPADPLQTQAQTTGHAGIPDFTGIRTGDELYVEYGTGERELYDLVRDPLELQNLAGLSDPAVLAGLSAWLDQLRQCSGPSCRTLENGPPASSATSLARRSNAATRSRPFL